MDAPELDERPRPMANGQPGPASAGGATTGPWRRVAVERRPDRLGDGASWRGYGLAVLVVGAALAVRALVDPLLGRELPFVFLFAAVVATAWYAGLGPGLVASALGYAGARWLFLDGDGGPPVGRYGAASVMGAVAYFATTGVISALGEGARRARIRAERAAEQGRRSRDQLQVLVQGISEGVTAHTRNGRLVYVNDAAARMSGFASVEEMLASTTDDFRNRYQLLDDGGDPLPWDMLPGRRAASDGQAHSAILRVRARGTGETRWAAVSASPVIGQGGEVELVVNVFRDLTEGKRAEEAWRFLAQASGALASSLDYKATLASVARLAVHHIADWCSVEIQAAEDGPLEQLAVAHVEPEKVKLAQALRQAWAPELGAGSALHETLQRGQSELIRDINDEVIARLPGQPQDRELLRQLGLRSAMLVPLTVQGRTFGVLAFVSAESGRRYGAADLMLADEVGRRASQAIESSRLYREARDAIAMRDKFLSMASHELKTPLSTLTLVVSGLARAARAGQLASMPADKLLARFDRFEKQADRLAALIDEMLDATRISAGRLILDAEEMDLVELTAEVVARFEDAAAQAHAPIALEAPDSIRGRWDRNRLDQVVTNLLSNAIKYGAGQPVSVSVSLSSPGGEAVVVVRDRGRGLDPRDQLRVFQQFERAASENYGGLGLGLWIARQIVELHGGRISVESRLGEGAAFKVTLPLEGPPVQPVPGPLASLISGPVPTAAGPSRGGAPGG